MEAPSWWRPNTIDIVIDIMGVQFGLRGYELAWAIIYSWVSIGLGHNIPGYNLA